MIGRRSIVLIRCRLLGRVFRLMGLLLCGISLGGLGVGLLGLLGGGRLSAGDWWRRKKN